MSRLPAESASEATMLSAMSALDERLAPTEFDVAALHTRLGARLWMPPRTTHVGLAIGGALLFGGASALAVSGWLGVPVAPPPPDSPRTLVPAEPSAQLLPPNGRVAAHTLAPTPRPEANELEQEPRSTNVQPAPTKSGSPSAASSELPSSAGDFAPEKASWALVTRALRSGQLADAERELDRLEAVAAPSEADAVALLRAQLAQAQGQTSRAVAEFGRLASDATDPLVRRRAKTALDKASER